MARQQNPYRPGFNQAPSRLVGREAVLAAAQEALEIAALDGRTPRPLILVGPRGVGKTVSLGEIGQLAAEGRGWPTLHLEVSPHTPVVPVLIERLAEATALLRQTTPRRGGRTTVTGGKVSAHAFGVGGEVSVRRRPPPRPTARLDAALAEAMEAALACGGGLVLAVDELQLAERAELGELAATLQQHVPDAWPLVVVVAGLPSLRDPGRSVTYLERGEWHELGLLGSDDTLAALTEPARAAGRPMSTAAARVLAVASGGYPYAVQVLGHHAWRASHDSRTITAEHAASAVAAADRDLSAGLYAARWNDAAPAEQDYLAALAGLPPGAGGGDVARALGKTPTQVSYLRHRLIKKGTLFPEGRALRFIVPGMAHWVTEHVGEGR